MGNLLMGLPIFVKMYLEYSVNLIKIIQLKKGGLLMKQTILLVLTIIFIALTLGGVIYVLMNHGTVSAGHAVVPMVFALSFGNWYRQLKKK